MRSYGRWSSGSLAELRPAVRLGGVPHTSVAWLNITSVSIITSLV